MRVPWIARRSNKSTLNIHVEAEGPILWLSDVKRLLIGKDPDAGED